MERRAYGICETDCESRVTAISETSAALIGMPAEAVLGRDLYDFVPARQVPMRRAMARSVAEHLMPYCKLNDFIRADGQICHVDVTLMPLRSESGALRGLLSLWQPIENSSDYFEEPINGRELLSPAAEYISSLLRELACLVGPTDERLRTYLLAALEVAMLSAQADRMRQVRLEIGQRDAP